MKNFAKIITIATLVATAGAAMAQQVRVPKNLTGLATTNQSYDFGDVLVGQTVYTTFTYKNESTQTLEIYSVTPKEGGTADIASTTCGSFLAAQDSCTFTVSLYVPSATIAGGVVEIKNNLTDGDTLTVSANGVSASNKVYMSPSSFTFNSSGELKDFVLTNATSNSIPISNLISSKAQFLIQSNTCAGSVPANGTCTIRTKFSASKTGTYTGILSVMSNGITVTKSSMTGIFAYGVPSFSGELTFSGLTANEEAPTRSATLTNIGIGVLYINNIDTDNPDVFKLKGNNCPTILNPGQSCSIDVSAIVPKGGTYVGAMQTSVSNAAGSKYYWNLYADSAIPSKLIQMIPASLNFEDINANTPKQMTVSVQSVGNLPAKISGYTISGSNPAAFKVVNGASCIGDLSSGNECILTVEANSTAEGAFSGALEVIADTTEPVISVPLQVKVLKPNLVATPSPVSVSGTKGGAVSSTIIVANTGSTSATINSITRSGSRAGVSLSGSCIGMTSLDKGTTCSLIVDQSNLVVGNYSENIVVSYSGGAQVLTIPVNTLVAGLDFEMSDFNCAAVIESAAGTCTATIYNNTTAPLGISSVTRSNTAFGSPTASATSIPANSSKIVTLPFTFNTAGTYTTNVTVATSKVTLQKPATAIVSSGPPAVASLGDFTCPANISATPGTCTATLTNTSTTKALVVGSITSSNGLFGTPSSNCGAAVAASNSCQITLSYPGFTTGGAYSTTVTVATTPTQTKSASVSITQPLLTATSDLYAVAARGSARKAYTIVFSNKGPVPVQITDMPVFLANSSSLSPYIDTALAQTCVANKTIAVNSTCLLNITFDTNSLGQFKGTVGIKFKGGTAYGNLDLKVLDSLYTIEYVGTKQSSIGLGSLSGNWMKFTNLSASPTILAARWINYPAGNFNKITSYTDSSNSNYCYGGKSVEAGGSCLFLEYMSSFGYTADPSTVVEAKASYIQLQNTSRVYWDPSYTVKRAAIGGSIPDALVVNGKSAFALTLTNTADQPVSGLSVSVSSRKGTVRADSASTCASLAPQQSCTLNLVLVPTALPSFSSEDVTVSVKGAYSRVISGSIQGSGDSVVVASVTKTLTVTNNTASWTVGKYAATKASASAQATHTLVNKNAAAITVSSVSLTGASAQTIVSETCTGTKLLKDQSCQVVTQQNVPANRQATAASLVATNVDGLVEQATIDMNVAPTADLSVVTTAPFAARAGTDFVVKYTVKANAIAGTATVTTVGTNPITCVPAAVCSGTVSPVTIKFPLTSDAVLTQTVSGSGVPAVTSSATIASDTIQDTNSSNDTSSAVTELRGEGEWLGIVEPLSSHAVSVDNLYFNVNNRATPVFTAGYKNPLWGGCWIYAMDFLNKTTLSHESTCGYRYSHHVPFDNGGRIFTYTTGKIAITDMNTMADLSTISDTKFKPYAAYVSDDVIYVFNGYVDGTGSISTVRFSGTSLTSVSHSPIVPLGAKFGERGAFSAGPDGAIYVGMQQVVYRADPLTGVVSVVPSLALPSDLPVMSQRFSSSYEDTQQGIDSVIFSTGLAFDTKGRAMRISNSCKLVEYPYLGAGAWGTPIVRGSRPDGSCPFLNFYDGKWPKVEGLYAHAIMRPMGNIRGKAIIQIFKNDAGAGAYSTTLQLK